MEGKGKKLHPLCWRFVEDKPLREAQPGPLTLWEWGQVSPTFFATTQYFPYKTAEVLIIQIRYQQLLVIEACCFPAQAGSGSPAEPFISGVTMTVRVWQWPSAAALSEHNKDFFTASPAIAQIRQRQKETELLANMPFSFCSTSLSRYFS